MLSIVKKLREVKEEVETERGRIVLFALLERADSSGKLDVIFSAPWIKRGQSERPALDYLIGKIRPKLSPRELIAVSRVIVFSPDEEFVRHALDLLRERGNPPRLANDSINGMLITTADIIAADPDYWVSPPDWDAEAMQKKTAEELEAKASS